MSEDCKVNDTKETTEAALHRIAKENVRLSAENSHYRTALGFVADLADKSGAANIKKLALAARHQGEEMERVSTGLTKAPASPKTATEKDGINDRGSDEYANPNWDRFKPGGAKGVLDTYRKLHDGKIGMHWLWAVIDRVVAGDGIDETLKDYGYERVEKGLARNE